jgi:hypothetical protein
MAKEGTMNIEEIETLLDEVDILKAHIKSDAMAYQADMKRSAAAHFNLDVQALYDMPHTEWAPIRARYLDEIYAKE